MIRKKFFIQNRILNFTKKKNLDNDNNLSSIFFFFFLVEFIFCQISFFLLEKKIPFLSCGRKFSFFFYLPLHSFIFIPYRKHKYVQRCLDTIQIKMNERKK